MTDKEKEAIEKLKETSKQCHNSKECWEKEDCPDCYVEVEDIFAIETVLKLIQTQKAEIEKYKYLYQKALDNTIKSDRELFDKKAELEKKDKMIEYMANFINDNTPYTKDTRILENERGVRNTKYTEKYFERKIK